MLTQEQRQDLFNRAVSAVIKQGQPARTPGGGYTYRNSDGLRCAIGHLLEEAELNRTSFIDKELGIPNVFGQVVSEPLTSLGGYTVGLDDATFLQTLQACHDLAARGPAGFPASDSEFLEGFKANAVRCARAFNLSTSQVL